MTAFHSLVLSTKGSDAEKWRSLVSKHPGGDIYFTPEYAMVFEAAKGETGKEFGGEAQLFFFGNEQNYIIYPFFKRKTRELPFWELLPPETNDCFDIVSPYGYSGPLPYISEPEFESSIWEGFFKEFHNYCLKNSIVAEFARLHPYLKNHLPLQKLANSNIQKRPEVVYVDLQQDEALMRKSMTKGNKSSVSKARRSGVEISNSSTNEEIDAFCQLYTATMERNRAKGAYFFTREFLGDTFRLLGDNVRLFTARYQDRIIAASLFLFQGNLAHYYLSGSDANFLSLCPNNLLLYQVILWAKERGYKIFNLGGGYEPNDSLFHFKSSFSKTTASFYTYSRVHNQEMYHILCQAKDEYDRLQGKDIIECDYFPRYRK